MSDIRIKAIVLDVDGVLTDGSVWWGPDDSEWKAFSFADIMGVARARRAGIHFALISGEDGPLIDRFAQKVGITHIFKNCKDKAHALKEFAREHALELPEIAFMGNDINDIEAMKIAGFSAAPADAETGAKREARLITDRSGGRGAVRELLERLFPAVFTV